MQIDADMNRLLKNAAGRRCEQKALRKRFLAQPDGPTRPWTVCCASSSFSSAIRVHSCPFAVKNLIPIRDHPRDPREKFIRPISARHAIALTKAG
jgi:hypothetical protein